MDTDSFSGILSKMKPKDGMEIVEYLKKVETKPKLTWYYVPYGVGYAQNVNVNCYTSDKQDYLTIEYNMPEENINEEGKMRKYKIVLATSAEKTGNFEAAKPIVSDFLNKSSIYMTLNSINPEICVAKLEKIGWKCTPEGIEFMQITKPQGITETRRIIFTQEELDSLTKENIEENKNQHMERREEQIINILKDYIIKTYKKIPSHIKGIQDYRKQVLEYNFNNSHTKKDSLLGNIFENMKPIKQEVEIDSKILRNYDQYIAMLIDMIPKQYRNIVVHDNKEQSEDNNLHDSLREYVRARVVASETRAQNGGELPSGSPYLFRLTMAIQNFDKYCIENQEIVTKEIREKADNILGKRKTIPRYKIDPTSYVVDGR